MSKRATAENSLAPSTRTITSIPGCKLRSKTATHTTLGGGGGGGGDIRKKEGICATRKERTEGGGITTCSVASEQEQTNAETLLSSQTKGLCILSVLELQGNDPHADQIAAVDSLVALRDDSLDTLQEWTPAYSNNTPKAREGKASTKD